jgi:5'-nucleotidase / UDP-sugar diphosphatase
MKIPLKYSVLFSFMVLLLIACKPLKENAGAPDKTELLHLLYVNDMHGNIDNFPRFCFMVDSIRRIHKNVFLLSAGDLFSGNPFVDMHDKKGYPMIDLMNDAGFNLSALGNHEFDYGQEILNDRMKQADFPFISGNIINTGGSLNMPKGTYQLKTKSGLIVYVFSVIETSSNGIPATHPLKLKGLKFVNGLEMAPGFRKFKKKANVFLALTHHGDDEDEKLAGIMPELDAIIGGHTHTIMEQGRMVNGVLIAQAGARLRFLGEMVLELKNGKVVAKKTKLLPISRNARINPDVKAKVDSYNTDPYFQEIVGTAAEDLKDTEEVGCFITDAYRSFANADIAFQNSGGIRIPSIEKGEISRALIFKLDPFGNGLTRLKMNVDELKSLIVANFENKIDLRVSGIHYNILTTNGKVTDILLTDYNGKPIDSSKKYMVAMNDYILNSYAFKYEEQAEPLGIITAEVLMEFLKKGKLNYSGVKRTFIDGN